MNHAKLIFNLKSLTRTEQILSFNYNSTKYTSFRNKIQTQGVLIV